MSFQQQLPQLQSLYIVNNLCGVDVTTLNDNMWLGRSVKETSPKTERNRNVEIVKRPPPPRQTSWWNDNEAKRKRRIAMYKLYAAQGKVKSSLKKGFRSIKVTCTKFVANSYYN